MIDGTYQAEIETKLGAKSGTATLRTEGGLVICDIDAPVIGTQHVEGVLEGDDAFIAVGTFKILVVEDIDYLVNGRVEGDELHVTVESTKGTLEFTAQRV